jgi:hypothetical protein
MRSIGARREAASAIGRGFMSYERARAGCGGLLPASSQGAGAISISR